MPVELWGTVADWVAGFGTVGTLAWAVVIFSRQVNDARQAQASRVIITLRYRPDGPYGEPPRIVVENFSPLPILNVYVAFDKQDGITGPMQQRDFKVGPARVDSNTEYVHDPPVDADLGIVMFTDVAGYHWQRDTHGTLKSGGRRIRVARFWWWRALRIGYIPNWKQTTLSKPKG